MLAFAIKDISIATVIISPEARKLGSLKLGLSHLVSWTSTSLLDIGEDGPHTERSFLESVQFTHFYYRSWASLGTLAVNKDKILHYR